MARYQSIVAYDGTAYHGFQRQADGLPTVQSELEAALRSIGWRGDSLLAAGRTDAGVHAQGQVIAFDHEWGHSMPALTAAINDHLPLDIGVQDCREVDAEFHPRFDARRRHYRYRLHISQRPDPLRVRYVWRRWSELDLAQMQRASAGFVGRYDFGAFGQAPIENGHTVRQVFKASWQAVEDELHFDIEADAFLQHMVRRLVAGLVQVGEGRLEAAELLSYLNKPGQRWQGNLAPPAGLFLMQVKYDRD